MKKDILELMKRQLKHIAGEMNYDNYKEMELQTHRVFTILESADTMLDSTVHQLSDAEAEEQTEYPPLISQILSGEEATEIEEDDSEDFMELLLKEENTQQAVDPDVYPFERRIRGGFIRAIEAFVPERVIREMDLSHGDLIRAKFRYKPTDAPARYDYELVKKIHPPQNIDNIIEVNMGIVSHEPSTGGYVIRKTVFEDEILHHGEPAVLPIGEDDLNNLDLHDGDIVNAAFYNNNTDFSRVRWKYSTEEVEEEQAKPKSASYYKKKSADDKETDQEEQIFAGSVIACMGYEPGWTGFREEVEKRGGEFVGLTGRESEETLAASLSKSDCLIMVLAHVGHSGTKFANAYCKEHNIPYDSMKTFGRSTFVNTADNLLGNKS